MAGGSNDVLNITDTSWQNAFNSLSYALGPGILMAPGATASSVYNMAAEAGRSQLRVAFLDGPDTPVASTVIAAARGVADAERVHSRYAGMFAPWQIVPGVTSGTVRKVPPSPSVAGIFARNMAAGYSANEPAAGELGRLRQTLAMTQTYTDADRQNLNTNGVNILRDIYGIFKVYGWRTTADPVNDPRWIALSNSILHRQIVAESNSVGERFIFRQIDGGGRLIGEFNGALVGEVCLPLFMAGSLYGDAPENAYKVDTGPSVNTDTTIANNELHAVISVRMAPFGEEVDIAIVKYLVTETIPA
jgi:phage tail sheath protein FI